MIKNIKTGNESLSDYSNQAVENIIETTKSLIEKTGRDFEKFPGKYLTESDARCFLYYNMMTCDIDNSEPHIARNNLNTDNPFNRLSRTKDEDVSKSIPLHTEIRWYGNEGRLKYRSDMVIIEVPDLRTDTAMSLPLPSKGFGFNKFNAIIEIKLRRVNGETDAEFMKKIKLDVKKLIEIENHVKGAVDLEYASFIFILDKKNRNGSMDNSINDIFFGNGEEYKPDRDLLICYFGSR
jgi:hypothetical protein